MTHPNPLNNLTVSLTPSKGLDGEHLSVFRRPLPVYSLFKNISDIEDIIPLLREPEEGFDRLHLIYVLILPREHPWVNLDRQDGPTSVIQTVVDFYYPTTIETTQIHEHIQEAMGTQPKRTYALFKAYTTGPSAVANMARLLRHKRRDAAAFASAGLSIKDQASNALTKAWTS